MIKLNKLFKTIKQIVKIQGARLPPISNKIMGNPNIKMNLLMKMSKNSKKVFRKTIQAQL